MNVYFLNKKNEIKNDLDQKVGFINAYNYIYKKESFSPMALIKKNIIYDFFMNSKIIGKIFTSKIFIDKNYDFFDTEYFYFQNNVLFNNYFLENKKTIFSISKYKKYDKEKNIGNLLTNNLNQKKTMLFLSKKTYDDVFNFYDFQYFNI